MNLLPTQNRWVVISFTLLRYTECWGSRSVDGDCNNMQNHESCDGSHSALTNTFTNHNTLPFTLTDVLNTHLPVWSLWLLVVYFSITSVGDLYRFPITTCKARNITKSIKASLCLFFIYCSSVSGENWLKARTAIKAHWDASSQIMKLAKLSGSEAYEISHINIMNITFPK